MSPGSRVDEVTYCSSMRKLVFVTYGGAENALALKAAHARRHLARAPSSAFSGFLRPGRDDERGGQDSERCAVGVYTNRNPGFLYPPSSRSRTNGTGRNSNIRSAVGRPESKRLWSSQRVINAPPGNSGEAASAGLF
jgi:hypothetical protein